MTAKADRLGVGFFGAGPVTQAIHLPVVARFAQNLSVQHIMDVDASLAEQVASLHGCKFSASLEDVLTDPDVDVIVVGSPHQVHAEQIIKIAQAGKRAILAEKPLAMSKEESSAIHRALENSQTLLVVGTMHAYDQAYLAALEFWRELSPDIDFIRHICHLPPNPEFVGLATELIVPNRAPRPLPDFTSKTVLKSIMRNGILTLAIHDVPLIRDLIGENLWVSAAEALIPEGHALTLTNGSAIAHFAANFLDGVSPLWRIEVIARTARMTIDCTPSYVLMGSATVRIESGGQVREWQTSVSGYESEWREIIDVLSGEKGPRYSLQRVIDDIDFALDIADQADQLMSSAGN